MIGKKEYVILVNNSDKRIGIAEKLDAHRKGLLHRAFSIFLFNDHGEMLLQKRAASKYHFAGLWTNACCSHPRPGERLLSAAARRLKEELHINTPLHQVGYLIYSFKDEKSGLIEHEFDYLLKGSFNGVPGFNHEEVSEVRWARPGQIQREIKSFPHLFTPWFKMILDKKISSLIRQ